MLLQHAAPWVDEPVGARVLKVQDLFREYALLDRKRTSEGVTPLEYQRWLDLKQRLGRSFSDGSPRGTRERRDSVRVPTRMKVAFGTREKLAEALMKNVSRGGLFINTPFAPDIGTLLELRIRVEATREEFKIPVEVVSNNRGADYSTAFLGMGVRFRNVDEDVRRVFDELYENVPVDDGASGRGEDAF